MFKLISNLCPANMIAKSVKFYYFYNFPANSFSHVTHHFSLVLSPVS